MKRIAALLMTLLLVAAAGMTALAAEPGTYTWEGHTIEVTEIGKGGLFAPANMTADDYCVSVGMKVDDELWQNEELGSALYAETVLTDAEGNVYAPGAALKGSKDPTRTYLFAVPKGIEISELTLRFGSETSEGRKAYIKDGMTFELTDVTEDLGEWAGQISSPEGKWALAVFTITDGEMPVPELETFIMDESGIRLNGKAPKTMTAKGIRIGEDMKVYAMGIINVFFDVPADLDVTGAEITVDADPAAEAGEDPVLAELAGTWEGTGKPIGGGTPIQLTVVLEPDGTGSHTVLQGGYRESYPIEVGYEESTFSASIPKDNVLGITSCGGTYELIDGVLHLSIETGFRNGRVFRYTAECERVS